MENDQKQTTTKIIKGFKNREGFFGNYSVMLGEFAVPADDLFSIKTAVLALCKVGELIEKYDKNFSGDDDATLIKTWDETPKGSTPNGEAWVTLDEAMRAFNDLAIEEAVKVIVDSNAENFKV